MTSGISKASIDIGIVTADAAALLAFYRDVLRLDDLGEQPMPGGTMHKLQCGESAVKIVQPRKPVAATAAPGGIFGGTGYRYWSIHVEDIESIVGACVDAGHQPTVPVTELRPGVRIAMVTDPDGNTVEFVEGG